MRVKRPLRAVAELVLGRALIDAQLVVTRRCNLSCGYCSEYDDVSEMIPLATLRERIDALHRLRAINISLLGGEPLMHPEITAVVAHADRHAQVSMTTNGFLLTQPLIEALNAAGLANMEVSIDSSTPDRSGFVQKCLKTVEPKLRLLRSHARFHVLVNVVLCERTREGFGEHVRRLNDLGFPVSVDLLHDAAGALQIGGPVYRELWRRHYAEATPFSFLEQDYAARLLSGEKPAWKCRAGSRSLYVDEWGKAQLCSAQRGRLGIPVVEYTREEAGRWHDRQKGCESGCSLLCHYRDSAFDNAPLRTLANMIRQVARRAPGRDEAVVGPGVAADPA